VINNLSLKLVGKFSIVFFLVFSSIYSDNQSIISYETKYANGSGSSIDYFENILDINYYFDNGVYVFSQLEYSTPPLFGKETEDLSDMSNILYVQYTGSKYDLTVGDLYLLYGMGLSLHSFQDQAIDFDNSIQGLNFNYYLNDKISVAATVGKSNVKARINPVDLLPTVSIKNNMNAVGISYTTNNMNFLYNNIVYEQFYDYSDINNLMNLENLLGQYLISRSDYILSEKPDFDMLNVEHNFAFDIYFDSMQLYLEKSIVYYDKLLAERTEGYKNYLTMYANVFDLDMLFEYKDYYTPLLYNVFSAPPIGYRESTSVLASRNLHTVDFSNELGYMIEINKSFSNSLNIVMSYSYALHHLEDKNNPSLFEYTTTAGMKELEEHWPYKQYYIEFLNTSKSEKFYYKVGYDYYHEISDLKTIIAKTIPMQYSYSFKAGNSVSFYIETQNKNDVSSNVKHDYLYFNPTYNHFGKWSFALFFDYEKNDDVVKGLNYTINLKKSQVSIFLGSQKEGLVCANGSCVLQPGFNEGLKLNYLTNF